MEARQRRVRVHDFGEGFLGHAAISHFESVVGQVQGDGARTSLTTSAFRFIREWHGGGDRASQVVLVDG